MGDRYQHPESDRNALGDHEHIDSLPEVFALPTTGWRVGMAAVTLSLLSGTLETLSPPFLEVGCGDGDLVRDLRKRHPGQQVIGLDLHPPPRSSQDSFPFVRADGQHLPIDDNTIGTLLAMDIFDQRGVELPIALAESWRVLVPGGLLVMRVSAHQPLYGPHDIAFNTERRYARAELIHTLVATGFRIERWTYANALLSPLLFPQRLLQRWRIAPWRPTLYRARWSNRLVANALKLEARWLTQHAIAFGLSLIVVARKEVGQ